jgi:hypothetical protein
MIHHRTSVGCPNYAKQNNTVDAAPESVVKPIVVPPSPTPSSSIATPDYERVERTSAWEDNSNGCCYALSSNNSAITA